MAKRQRLTIELLLPDGEDLLKTDALCQWLVMLMLNAKENGMTFDAYLDDEPLDVQAIPEIGIGGGNA